MKKIIDTWFCGWCFLLYDDLFSYYAFFTTILIEIAYLWAFVPSIALPFTIILATCIFNVCFCASITYKVSITCFIYLGIFILSMIIGCFISFWTSILLITLPFILTVLLMFLRSIQISLPINFSDKSFFGRIYNWFENKNIVYFISQILVTFAPFIVFTVFLAMTPIPLLLKILIPIFYLLIMPFIAYMEDTLATLNIFELFFPYC